MDDHQPEIGALPTISSSPAPSHPAGGTRTHDDDTRCQDQSAGFLSTMDIISSAWSGYEQPPVMFKPLPSSCPLLPALPAHQHQHQHRTMPQTHSGEEEGAICGTGCDYTGVMLAQHGAVPLTILNGRYDRLVPSTTSRGQAEDPAKGPGSGGGGERLLHSHSSLEQQPGVGEDESDALPRRASLYGTWRRDSTNQDHGADDPTATSESTEPAVEDPTSTPLFTEQPRITAEDAVLGLEGLEERLGRTCLMMVEEWLVQEVSIPPPEAEGCAKKLGERGCRYVSRLLDAGYSKPDLAQLVALAPAQLDMVWDAVTYLRFLRQALREALVEAEQKMKDALQAGRDLACKAKEEESKEAKRRAADGAGEAVEQQGMQEGASGEGFHPPGLRDGYHHGMGEMADDGDDKDKDGAINKLVREGLARGVAGMEGFLLEHQDRPQVLWRAFGAMATSAAADTSKLEALVASTSIPSMVLDALRRFPTHAKVQASGAGLLATLAGGDVVVKDGLVGQGALGTILEALNTFSRHEKVLEEGFHAVAALGCNSNDDGTLLAQCLVEVAFDALEHFPHNLKIQSNICDVISYLSTKTKVNSFIFAEKDPCKYMLRAMESFGGEVTLLTWAGLALGSLCEGNTTNCTNFLASRGPQILSGVLQSYAGRSKNLEEAVVYACWALLTTQPESNHHLGKAGMVQAAVGALRNRSGLSDMALLQGINMLCWLGYKDASNARRFLDAGGPTVLVSLQEASPFDEKVQHSVAEALVTLATEDQQMVGAFCQARACEQAAAAFHRFSDPDYLTVALQALALLASFDEESGRQLLEGGVLTRLLEYLRGPSLDDGEGHDASLVGAVVSLLRGLAKNHGALCPTIQEGGGFDYVLEGLKQFRDERDLQCQGLELLAMWPDFVLNHGQRDEGFAKMVVEAMDRFHGDHPVMISTWKVISILLSRDGPLHCRNVIGLEVVDTVVKTMEASPDDVLLQLEACSILVAMAGQEPRSIAERATRAGLMDFLLKSLEARGSVYRADRRLQIHAIKMISLLGDNSPEAKQRFGRMQGGELVHAIMTMIDPEVSGEEEMLQIILGHSTKAVGPEEEVLPPHVEEDLGMTLSEAIACATTDPVAVLGHLGHLQDLGAASAALVKHMGDKGAHELLFRIMDAHPTEAAIQTSCSHILATLCSHASNREAIASFIPCRLVLEAMKAHSLSGEVQVQAFKTLTALVKANPECVKWLRDLGVCEALVGHAGGLQDYPDITSSASAAIIALCEGSEHCQAALGKAGACALLSGWLLESESLDTTPTLGLLLTAIASLAKECGANAQALREHKLVLVLSRLLVQKLQDVHAMMPLLAVIKEMASAEADSQEAMCHGNIPSSIMRVMEVFEASTKIQAAAWDAMAAVCLRCQPAAESFHALGAVDALKTVLDRQAACCGIVVQPSVLRAVTAFAEAKSDLRALLGDLNFCPSVLGVMHGYGADAAVQAACAGCIRALAHKDRHGICDQLGELGACELTTSAFRRFMNRRAPPRVQHALIQAITALASSSDKNRDRLRSGGACQLLVTSLRADEETAPHCWRAMASLAGGGLSVASGDHLREAERGVCELLIDMMSGAFKAGKPLDVYFEALAGLAYKQPANCQRMVQAGAFQLLAGFLGRYKLKPFLPTECCEAVGHLTLDQPDLSTQAAETGLCEMVLRAIQYEPENLRLLSTGMYAIRNLAASSRDVAKHLGGVGACEAVMAAARQAGGGYRLHVLAYESLSALAHSSVANCAIIRGLGGCEDLVTTMRRYKEDAVMQMVCCGAMGRLLSLDRASALTFGACAGMEALVAAITHFMGLQDLQHAAWDNLCLLSIATEGHTARFFAMSGHQMPTTVMSVLRQDPTIQLHLVEVVGVLASLSADNANLFATGGACEAIIAAMRSHLTQGVLQARASECLRKLCRKSPVALGKVVDGGALETFAQAMAALGYERGVYRPWLGVIRIILSAKADPSNQVGAVLPTIIRVLTGAALDKAVVLETLAFLVAVVKANKKNRDVLGKAGACQLVVSMLAEYKHDDHVWPMGLVTIRALVADSNANLILLYQAGFSELLIQIWACLPDTLSIHVEALGFAIRLAALEGAVAKLGHVGVIDLIQATMVKFHEDPRIRVGGTHLAVALACHHVEFAVKLGGSASICGMVVANLRRYTDNTSTLAMSLSQAKALCTCTHTNFRAILVEAGIAEPLMAVMTAPGVRKQVFRSCITVLEDILKEVDGTEVVRDLATANVGDALARGLSIAKDGRASLYMLLHQAAVLTTHSLDVRARLMELNYLEGLGALLSQRDGETEVVAQACEVAVALAVCGGPAVQAFIPPFVAAWAKHIASSTMHLSCLKAADAIVSRAHSCTAETLGQSGGCKVIALGMREHPDRMDIQALSCSLVLKLCTFAPGNVEQFRAALPDVIEACLLLIVQQSPNSEAWAACIDCINVLAQDSDVSRRCSAVGIPVLMATTLKELDHRPALASRVATSLKALCSATSEGSRRSIANSLPAMSALVGCLTAHTQDASLCHEILDCLALLLEDAPGDFWGRCWEFHLSPALLHTVHKSPLESEALGTALRLVAKAAESSSDKDWEATGDGACLIILCSVLRRYFCDDGIRPLIMHALLAHLRRYPPWTMDGARREETKVCELTMAAWKSCEPGAEEAALFCEAVGLLAKDDLPSSARLGDAGACDLVVQSMKRFPDHGGIQRSGCRAVCNLAAAQEGNVTEFVAAGVCEVLLQRVTPGSADPELTCEACDAIRQVAATNLDACDRLGALGACRQILALLESLSDSSSIEATLPVLRCFAELVSKSAVDGKHCAECKALEILLSLFKAPEAIPSHTPVAVGIFLFCIQKLSSSKPSYFKVTAEGGAAMQVAKVIHASMTNWPQDGLVMRPGLQLISSLVEEDNGYRQLFFDLGIPAVVAKAMRELTEADATMFTLVCQAAALVCLDVEECKQHFRSEGLVEVALERWEKHHGAVAGDLQTYRFIINISSSHPESAALAGDRGGMGLVVKGMKRYAFDGKLMAHGCWVIKVLAAAAPENAGRACEAGACEMVVECLQNFLDEEHTSTRALETIHILAAASEAASSRLGACGVCEEVVDYMKKTSDDGERQTLTCSCISALGDVRSNATALVQSGALECITNALCKFPEDGTLYAAAMTSLRTLTAASTELHEALQDEYLYPAIVGGLHSLDISKEVTLETLAILHLLACSSLNVRQMLGQAGACEAVLAVARRFPDDHMVNLQLCHLIRAMAVDCPRNRTLLGKHGACEFVCSLWSKLSPSEDLARHELCDLAGLLAINDPANSVRLGKAGACELLRDAIEAYSDDTAFRNKGCLAMAALATSVPENGQRLGGPQPVCSFVMSCLESSVKGGQHAEPAMEAARVLITTGEEYLARLPCCHVGDILLTAMKKLADDVTVQTAACKCMAALLKSTPSHTKALVHQGVGSILSTALAKHSQQESFSTAAFQLIAVVCRVYPNECRAMGEEGLCDALAKCISPHSRNGDTFTALLVAITALISPSPTNRSLMADSGACEELCTAMKLPHTTAIKTQLFQATRALAHSVPKNAAKLGQHGACGFTMDLWKAARHASACVQFELVDMVGILANQNKTNGTKLGELGACELLIKTLQRFPQEKEIMTCGLSALTHLLSATSTNIERLDVGAVYPLVIVALDHSPDDTNLQVICCSLVSSLAKARQENKLALGSQGACGLIVEIMKAYPNDCKIQAGCCGAMGYLAEGCPDNAVALGNPACNLLLTAMRNFRLDRALQADGLRAIVSLSKGSQSCSQCLGEGGACELLMKAVRTFAGDYEVLARGMVALSTLAALSIDSRVKLGAAGACDVAVNALKASNEDTQIIAWACDAIRILAQEVSANAWAFGRIGALEEIMRVVKAIPDDVEVVRKGLEALRALSYDAQNNAMLGTMGACELLVKLVGSYDNKPAMLTVCFALLSRLATNATNQTRLIAAGAALLIFGIVRRLQSDADIQATGWTALARLAAVDTQVAKALGEGGACPMVTQLFLTFPGNHGAVWAAACEAMGALAYGYGPNGQQLFSQMHASDLLVRAMNKFPTDSHLQAQACHAVSVFAVDCTTADTDRRALWQSGLPVCLIAACDRFPGDPAVQGRALNAIGKVTSGAKASVKASLGEACERVLRALRAFGEDEVVLTDALFAADMLATDCPTNREILLAGGVVDHVTEALGMFATSLQVQRQGCQAVAALTQASGDACDAFLSLHVEQAIARAMKAFLHDGPLQVTCCGVIEHLGYFHNESQALFGKLEVCELLVGMLQVFEKEPKVLVKLCEAVGALAYDIDNNKRFNKAGICAAMNKILSSFVWNLDVQAAASYTTWVLASSSMDNKLALVDLGVMDQILHALNILPDHSQVQAAGFYAMANLTAAARASTMTTSVNYDVESYCKLIVNGLRTFRDDAAFQEEGSYALTAAVLCAPSPDIRGRLGTSGACEVVATALSHFKDTVEVQCQGLHAVASLGCNTDANCSRFVKANICPLIMAALRRFDGSRMLKLRGVQALEVIAAHNAEGRRLLGDLGACEKVTALLITCGGRAMQLASACLTALAALIRDNENRRRLQACDVCEALMSVLKPSQDHQQVQAAGFQLLEALAMEPRGKQSLKGAGVMTMLKHQLNNSQDPILLVRGLHLTTAVLEDDPENQAIMKVMGAEEIFERIRGGATPGEALFVAATGAIATINHKHILVNNNGHSHSPIPTTPTTNNTESINNQNHHIFSG